MKRMTISEPYQFTDDEIIQMAKSAAEATKKIEKLEIAKKAEADEYKMRIGEYNAYLADRMEKINSGSEYREYDVEKIYNADADLFSYHLVNDIGRTTMEVIRTEDIPPGHQFEHSTIRTYDMLVEEIKENPDLNKRLAETVMTLPDGPEDEEE